MSFSVYFPSLCSRARRNTMLRWCVLAAVMAMLCACAGRQPLQRSQTMSISRGLPSTEAGRVLGNATLLSSQVFSSQGQQYRADHYDLQTGTRQQVFTHCPSRRRACVPVIQSIPITDWYVVVYHADRVYAWGTVEELSRSPDDSVSSIMPDLKRAYLAPR